MAEIYKSNAISTDNSSTHKIICPMCRSSYIGTGINKTTNTQYNVCLNCNYIFYDTIIIKNKWLLYNTN